MPKPPKPEDLSPASRRTKCKSEYQADLNACMGLASSDLDIHETIEFIKQTRVELQDNDRALAIMLAVDLETSLEAILRSNFVQGRCGRLFKLNGPLSTFASKIDMAFAMGIFDENQKKNLDIIRVVRNAFAHSKKPITFKTSQINKLCHHLALPDDDDPENTAFIEVLFGDDRWKFDPTSAKDLYSGTCQISSSNLRVYSKRKVNTLP